MRALLQRVKRAKVTATETGRVVGAINAGLVALIGICEGDTRADLEWIANKILAVRLWEGEDDNKPWKRNVVELRKAEHHGCVLAVSQFTLYGQLKGNKPDFHRAMREGAERVYDDLVEVLRSEMVKRSGGQGCDSPPSSSSSSSSSSSEEAAAAGDEALVDRRVAVGAFGAMMDVELVNDGPVTLMLDSRNKKNADVGGDEA